MLGNFKLRKLYDKGILHTAGTEFADQVPTEEEVEDDAQTKFYKQRLKRAEAPTAEGDAIQYDLDKWTREQYIRSFNRKQSVKEKYEMYQNIDKAHKQKFHSEITVYVAALFLLIFVIYGLMPDRKATDEYKVTSKKE